MTNGSTDTRVDARTVSVEAESSGAERIPGGFVSAFGIVFGPLGRTLGRLRDLAAAPPESMSRAAEERPLLDVIAFREVLPILEERHLLLSEIKALSRGAEDANPERLDALRRRHEESLPGLLERIERATMCVHSRCHHEIRDMLENVVLFDNFINDFYLRNICNTMKDAIEKASREG